MERNIFSDLLAVDIVRSIFPLVRVKALQSIGGFDEEMVAAQDLDTWLRLSEHYPLASVNEILAICYRYKDEHVWGSPVKPIQGLERIISKNKAHYEKNKYAYWMRLRRLTLLYRHNGETIRSLGTWLKLVSLRLFSVASNVWTLFKALLPFGFYEDKRQKLVVNYPRVHSFLASCKRFLKGEKKQ